MFLNPYQKYIDELISEYGPLPIRQLVSLVNSKFRTNFTDLDRYVMQMESFYYYTRSGEGEEALVYSEGMQPDYDIIRSVDVMLAFGSQLLLHRKGREYVSVRFYVNHNNHTREVSVIPVRQGEEKFLSAYADDKFADSKSSITMFLLEDKAQMKSITAQCNHRFAVIGKGGVSFYKGK